MSLTQDLRWSLGRSIALQLQRQTDLLLCTINCFLQWDHLPNMAVGDLAFYYTLYLWLGRFSFLMVRWFRWVDILCWFLELYWLQKRARRRRLPTRLQAYIRIPMWDPPSAKTLRCFTYNRPICYFKCYGNLVCKTCVLPSFWMRVLDLLCFPCQFLASSSSTSPNIASHRLKASRNASSSPMFLSSKTFIFARYWCLKSGCFSANCWYFRFRSLCTSVRDKGNMFEIVNSLW